MQTVPTHIEVAELKKKILEKVNQQAYYILFDVGRHFSYRPVLTDHH